MAKPTPKFHGDDGSWQINQLRSEFGEWYTINTPDYAGEPIGSRRCDLQWRAWLAARMAAPEGAQGAVATVTMLAYSATDRTGMVRWGGEDGDPIPVKRGDKLYAHPPADAEDAIAALVAGPHKFHHKMDHAAEREAKAFNLCRKLTLQNIATYFATKRAIDAARDGEGA